MIAPFSAKFATFLALLLGGIPCASAAVIVSPTSVIANTMGQYNPYFAVGNLINRSVNIPFVSGVTDANSYFSAAASSTDYGPSWTAAPGFTPGSITFDLGEEFSLKAILLWNDVLGSGPGGGVWGFTVDIDDNVSFSSPSRIYNSTLLNMPLLQVKGGIAYDFNPSLAVVSRYVRFNINSTQSGAPVPSFREIAFAVDPVPEPATAVLMMLGSLGALGRRRRGSAV